MKYLHTYISMVLVLILTGCATGPGPVKGFISPSQALYDEADAYFKEKDYDAAISIYEKFIEAHPRHDLAPGAHLGITWSYYLKGEYDKSLQAKAKVRTKDADLKAWLENLADACKAKLASAPSASTTSRLFDIPPFTNQGTLKVDGTIPKDSTISINETEVAIKDGLFSQEVSLVEGENLIKIEITDKDGNIEIKDAKVALDTVPPTIEVVDAELDDLGYVTISGITEVYSVVIAEDEELFVSPKGKFEGEVKLPRNLKIGLTSEDRAGNITKMTFADTEYPDQPTGLFIRDTYGTNVDLEWDENSEEDIKGYNVYYSLVGVSSDQRHNTELIEETTYTMVGLISGSTYNIYIRAVDKMGNESDPSWDTVNAVIP
ncbi:fibronectin type III domain-containing protein [Candidatus Omnitrophota bacterium]